MTYCLARPQGTLIPTIGDYERGMPGAPHPL